MTHAEIEDGVLGARGMLLYVSPPASPIAPIRNRGTIGGSLAHADPAADWPLALVALDAPCASAARGRAHSFRSTDFIVGAFTTALAEAGIIDAIEAPRASPAARWGY